MATLITGATGFVGRVLTAELLGHGHEVIATGQGSGSLTIAGKTMPVHPFDILDPKAMANSLKSWAVDRVVHLAAISHQGEAAKDLSRLHDVNVMGCRYLVEALAALARPIDLLFVSSALVYDPAHCLAADGRHHVMSETSLALPSSVYGQSKLAAENSLKLLCHGSQVTPFIVRPGNHIGPGQRPIFAVPSFAERIAAAADGGSFVVGNVDVARDFTDVRDMVRAYRLILELRPKERLFTLGASKSVTIKSILELLIATSGKSLRYEVNPDLVRPGEPADIVVDASLARKVLGWQPEIPLRDTLARIYSAASGQAEAPPRRA